MRKNSKVNRSGKGNRKEDGVMEFTKATDYIFNRFDKKFALATAGNIDDFDGCTIGWGSVGSLWGFTGHAKKVITIYVNPLRFTSEYLLKNDYFTVSFFDPSYQKDLLILGSRSKRNGDKFAITNITPEAHGDKTVVFKEAALTLVCRKLYWEQFDEDHVDPEIIKGIYEKTGQPMHYQFIGEIVEEIGETE